MQKIQLVAVARRFQLVSDGSTTWTYVNVDLGDSEAWGPFVEQITAHTQTIGATARLEWKPVFWWGFDDANVVMGPVDLVAAIVTNGTVIGTPYTATNTLGLKMRFGLAVRSSSAGAPDRGLVSCVLSFQFRT